MTKRFYLTKSIMLFIFLSFYMIFSFKISAKAIQTDEMESTLLGAATITVESYSIENDYLEAGKDAAILLKVHNNGGTSASNVILTISCGNDMLYPSYGNGNQIYIGGLGAGVTKEVTIPVTVSSSFEQEAIDINCNFIYIASGKQLTNTSTIVIPAQSSSTIEVKSIGVSKRATVNGKSLLSVSYVNNSRTNITDARIVIEGNVSDDSSVIAMDTIEADKSYSKDYQISYSEVGEQNISISLVYTDTNGDEVNTDLGNYIVTVSESNGSSLVEEGNVVLTWIGRVIALVALLVACFVIVSYIRKR